MFRISCLVICTLPGIATKRKVISFGHVARAKGTLANTILQVKLRGNGHEEGHPDIGWPDVEEWTEIWRKS